MKKSLFAIPLVLSIAATSAQAAYDKDECNQLSETIDTLLADTNEEWGGLLTTKEGSKKSKEHAKNIEWLTSVAGNYASVYSVFCE